MTLPIRIIITVFVFICSIVLSLSGVFFGIASGLLGLLGLIVLTYSVHNALILFALALLVSDDSGRSAVCSLLCPELSEIFIDIEMGRTFLCAPDFLLCFSVSF